MNGTPPIVQTEHVDEHMVGVYISFIVPARYVDYGQLPAGAPHPMVALATVGKTAPIRLTRERTVMENCLQLLQNIVGCFVPDLSYFKLRQLETGEATCRCLNLSTSMGGTRIKVEGGDRHDLEPEGTREDTRHEIYTGLGSRSSYPTSCLE
jgi:hypothetical protein